MKELIDVFRMEEISHTTRANVIVKLGDAINGQFGSNLTEPLVYELVSILNPDHPRLKDPSFLYQAGVITLAQYRERTQEPLL